MPSDKDIVVHHVVGNSLDPGGVMKGCAHGDSERRAYVAFGTLPNPECPMVTRWNEDHHDHRS